MTLEWREFDEVMKWGVSVTEFYPNTGQFFELWSQSLRVMKDEQNSRQPVNEGIWFIEEG